MTLPVLTPSLAERLERSEIEYMSSRMAAIREREGNPEGVEIETFGGAVAYYANTMPWGSFNTVKGLSSADADQVDRILAFYQERERACQFEIIPSKSNAELQRLLADRGFYQSGFHTTMYGVPNVSNEEPPPHITIREIEENEFELYGKLHCLGSGMNESGAPYVAANNRVLFNRPGWRIFLGFVEGVPAGVAAMHMAEGIASLTFAATLPQYRRRGLQSAFLRKRMQVAASHSCQLVVGQCAYASTSQNNMERAGMRIGYTRATWVEKR
ncbi:GNAT family N-acetyltransferase [Paenibacillus sp. NPDC058071]|uniref:GNAT family N-acetyltransferase n=1 Tax=Paenibacillus sp. NPDC058071 TaxID=3346326 RepID=UPI0036D9CDFF